MRLIATFFVILALSCLFLSFPDTSKLMEDAGEIELTQEDIQWMKNYRHVYRNNYHDFFLMTDSKVPWSYYVDSLVQHAIIIMLVLLAAERSKPFEVEYINAFLVIQCLDALDFFLNNNEKYGNSNLTFNIVAPFLFGAFCVYIYSKNGNRSI